MTFRLPMFLAVPLVLASNAAYAGQRSPPLTDGSGPVIVAPTTDQVRALYASRVLQSSPLSDGSGVAITASTTDQVRALAAHRAPAAPVTATLVLASTASFDKRAPDATSSATKDPAPQTNRCTCAQHR